jgi:hypothetical protein
MKALRIYAGAKALAVIRERGGLSPEQVRVIPAAAGGPKGLMLLRLDQYLFGEWLKDSSAPLHLVGASIGAWRMATVCLRDPLPAIQRLEHDYIHQHFEPPPGQRKPSARQVSASFADSLRAFYEGRVAEVLSHPHRHLHVVVSRGRALLKSHHSIGTSLGFAAAFLANAVERRYLGGWLERGILSCQTNPELPLRPDGFPTRHWQLSEDNFMEAVRASCSIPFAMEPVIDIPQLPEGAYWDGGLTDYHLHWGYQLADEEVVLYPHFQRHVIPGWLDKAWKSRHSATAALDQTIVLAPDPDWVARLPGGKLPDRHDFVTYADHFEGRVAAWGQAVAQSQQLADEWQSWLAKPDMDAVQVLS